MRLGIVAGGVVAAAVAASVAVVVSRPRGHERKNQGPAAGSRQSSGSQEPAGQLETIRGEVLELPGGGRGRGDGKGPGANGPTAPLITVRSEQETIRVHAGPPRFHEQIGLSLAIGDQIEVTGRRQGAPGKATLLAERIKKGDHVYRVRDENGGKLWKPKRKDEVTLSAMSGKIVDLAPELTDHAPGRERSGTFVAVETEHGRIAVQIGPEAFRKKQGLIVEMGDRIEIDGWLLPGAFLLDQPLMLAETIQKGDQKLRLRDEHRLPLWNGSSAGDR